MRSVEHVSTPARYLVELEAPPDGWQELQAVAARARAAAEQLNGEGTPVRFLRSIFVPEQETCFFLFQGDRPGVYEAIERAGLSVRAFVEPVSGTEG